MDTKTKLKVISVTMRLVAVFPIFFYLAYRVLALVEATPFMWYLFWTYIPLVVIASLLAVIIED